MTTRRNTGRGVCMVSRMAARWLGYVGSRVSTPKSEDTADKDVRRMMPRVPSSGSTQCPRPWRKAQARRRSAGRRTHAEVPLAGTADDYGRARSYLDGHRSHMDYTTRRKAGDPIGSGVTEAGCEVIFNQRMKQSGMRRSRRGGQHVVDLRTACRSRLWERIWSRGLDDYTNLPETNSTESRSETPELSKSA